MSRGKKLIRLIHGDSLVQIHRALLIDKEPEQKCESLLLKV
jgi:hypothetical protein